MKILITGCNGQLGQELKLGCPSHINAIYTDSTELDITDHVAVDRIIRELKPDVVINAAAYTAVDKAESDPQLCQQVNAEAVGYLAVACEQNGVRLIHISTDFVFDGTARTAYQINDLPAPLSVYGKTKLAGEQQVIQHMKSNFAIVRTSWVYSCHGNNFVKTMLRLMAEKTQLGVVADQIGAPTWAANLAQVSWQLAQDRKVNGIFHWSDTGPISWYDFALAIEQAGIEFGLLSDKITINPITTADYPTPAKRPAFSHMDCSALEQALNISQADWQISLKKMVADLAAQHSI